MRTQDSAIVAAANLSNRYITDRFLPDKAIDLVDEAASRIKIELDSMPTEIDVLEREVMQLEMQRQVLKKEKDPGSKARLENIEKDIADLKEKSNVLKAQWMKEKEAVQEGRKIKEEIDRLRTELDQAQRRGDFARAGEIQYGLIPELEKKLEESGHNHGTGTGKAEPTLLREEVTEEDIAKVVSNWTGIPISRLQEGEREKLVKMEARLGERVIGQREAINAVANAVRRARAGIQDENRPIGSFLFLGPTGVGKTELSKALAEFLFDDENAMTRLDMSEYMEKHSVSRLIGAPPGYVGYEEGGQLSEAVRRRPYSVVLFDEVEKAHPDVMHLLLQILEEGQVTDNFGRKIDFRNTVVILTSNVGAESIKRQTSLGFGAMAQDSADHEGIKGKIGEQAKKFFKPEFLNRLDDIVVFRMLEKSELTSIVDLEVSKVVNRLKAKKIELQLDQSAREFLIKEGYDPQYGARPMRRAVEKHIEDPLAEHVLRGDVKPGDRAMVSAYAQVKALAFTPAKRDDSPEPAAKANDNKS